jgi:hypothetical protein
MIYNYILKSMKSMDQFNDSTVKSRVHYFPVRVDSFIF